MGCVLLSWKNRCAPCPSSGVNGPYACPGLQPAKLKWLLDVHRFCSRPRVWLIATVPWVVWAESAPTEPRLLGSQGSKFKLDSLRRYTSTVRLRRSVQRERSHVTPWGHCETAWAIHTHSLPFTKLWLVLYKWVLDNMAQGQYGLVAHLSCSKEHIEINQCDCNVMQNSYMLKG